MPKGAFGGKADRAKQFAPFATLKGYYDNIASAERVPAYRRELPEEDALRLSQILAGLHKGDMVRITYYDTNAYVTMTGAVSEVVEAYRFVRIIKTQIAFEDIWDIELLK